MVMFIVVAVLIVVMLVLFLVRHDSRWLVRGELVCLDFT